MLWLVFLRGYLRFAWQLVNGARVAHERMIAAWRARDLASLGKAERYQRVLDLANGQLRPQYALLRAAGHCVVGIDLANRPSAGWRARAYRLARTVYNTRLPAPQRLASAGGLVCGDVSALPFADASFDLVTSVAAFEHFLDVPMVVAELARVMRAEGIAWICIHLFTSPSGGHTLGFVEVPLRHVPWGVEPWDHLRKRRLAPTVPLNEWRIVQYRAEFARHFEIVKEYCALREGEHLLTVELEKELSAYSRDELTCGTYVFVLRKPTLQ